MMDTRARHGEGVRLTLTIVLLFCAFYPACCLLGTEPLEVSRDQPVRVEPEDGVCGLGPRIALRYHDTYINCARPTCNRTYPRQYSRRTQLINGDVTFNPPQCNIPSDFQSASDYYDVQSNLEYEYFNDGGTPDKQTSNVPFESNQCWYSFKKEEDWPKTDFVETYSMEVTPNLESDRGTLFIIPAAEFEVYLEKGDLGHPNPDWYKLIIQHKAFQTEYQSWTLKAHSRTDIALQINYRVNSIYDQYVISAAVFIDGRFIDPVFRPVSKPRRRKRNIAGEKGVSIRIGAPHPIYGAVWSERQPSCQLLSIEECLPIVGNLGAIGAINISDVDEVRQKIKLVKEQCSQDLNTALLFACSYYFQPCQRSSLKNIRPCVGICNAARSSCPALENIMGLQLGQVCQGLPPNGTCVNATFSPDSNFFKGQIHSFDVHGEILSNREITALATGRLLNAQPVSECLCPSDYPALWQNDSNSCVAQGDQLSQQPPSIPRVDPLNVEYYPPSNLVDGSPSTAFVSTPGMDGITVSVSFQQNVILDRLVVALETHPPQGGIQMFSKSIRSGDEWKLIGFLSYNCSALGLTNDYYEDNSWRESKIRCLENAQWQSSFSSQTIPLFNLEAVDSLYILEGYANQENQEIGGGHPYDDRMVWMDNDYLSYLLASEIKMEFVGYPMNVSNIPGGSSTDKYHAISEVQANGWAFDASFCNCHPLGVRNQTDKCDAQGACICRAGAGEPEKAKHQCNPYVDAVYPNVGPVSGGTHVLIFGGFFGSSNISSWDVSFGGIDFETIFTNETLIIARARNLTEIVGPDGLSDFIGIPQRPYIRSTDRYSFVLHVDEDKHSFTYKNDPIIDKIEPLSSFLRGGIEQTVTGQYLDSVAHPLFEVTVVFQGNMFKQKPTICEVLNNSTYMCPSPEITNVPKNFEQSRRKKRQAGILNRDNYKEFYIGFKLDGVIKYNNVSEVLPTYGTIHVFSNPNLRRFDPDVKVFKTKSQTTIEIEKDYNVTIGNAVCGVVSLYTNVLRCTPPLTKPELGEFSEGDHPQVIAKVGNINFVVGYLRYQETPWDNPAVKSGVIGAICALLILAIIIVVIVFLVKRRKRPPYSLGRKAGHFDNEYIGMDNAAMGRRPLEELLDDSLKRKIDACKVDSNYMTMGKPLGKGNFGMVYAGVLADANNSEKVVAIKTVKGVALTSQQKIEFLEEATIMMDFNHENVLSLTAICIKEDMPYVVLPIMENGDLKSCTSNSKNTFTVKDLMMFGLQVARGMAYLSEKKFIHRDLAARNCMVDKDWLVKIADFGLARDLFQKDYYKIQDKQRPLPVKWMAVESLEGHKFSSKSDMWSYGVLFWELLTRGQRPYADVNNHEMKQYLSLGRRLSKPNLAPDEVYEIMLSCWRENPDERPKFNEVVQRLEELLDIQGTESNVASGGDDGYLAPRDNNSYSNPDYVTLLNTEAPAPYGGEEGYLPMNGSSA